MKYITLLFLIVGLNAFAQTKGYIQAMEDGFPSETLDRHFFGTNQTANANRTHDANNKTITINELGGWTMSSGTGEVSFGSMQLDSAAIALDGIDINIDAEDNLFLSGGAASISNILLSTAKISLDHTDGEIEIENLDRDDTRVDVVGISSATGKLYLKNHSIFATHTPSSAGDTGTEGDIAWDANYIYVCVATNTWKRVATATW